MAREIIKSDLCQFRQGEEGKNVYLPAELIKFSSLNRCYPMQANIYHYCVSTNFLLKQEHLVCRYPLSRLLRASKHNCVRALCLI